jgi:hypothetical protein
MLIFICTMCGKSAERFEQLSHEDCPEQKAVRAGHAIVTQCKQGPSNVRRDRKQV